METINQHYAELSNIQIMNLAQGVVRTLISLDFPESAAVVGSLILRLATVKDKCK